MMIIPIFLSLLLIVTYTVTTTTVIITMIFIITFVGYPKQEAVGVPRNVGIPKDCWDPRS